MDPADLDRLERLVDDELRQLPVPRAPGTLLPRVLAAVEQRAQPPWYRRAWRTWPVGAQIASAAFCLLILAVAITAPRQLLAGVARLAATSHSVGETIAAADQAQSATRAAWVLWRVVLQPLVPYAFAVSMLMCVACVVFGVALNYVVFGRTLHR
jgi:hypothetical protein